MKRMRYCLGLLWFFSMAVMAQDFARTAEENAMCVAVINQGRITHSRQHDEVNLEQLMALVMEEINL